MIRATSDVKQSAEPREPRIVRVLTYMLIICFGRIFEMHTHLPRVSAGHANRETASLPFSENHAAEAYARSPRLCIHDSITTPIITMFVVLAGK
jgi:hypothetical protein